VVVEVAAAAPTLENIRRLRVQRYRRPLPLRFIEILWILLVLRYRGYSTIYVHYSHVAAVAAAIITRLFGGRTFYWNCGLQHMFFRRLGLDRETWRAKLHSEWPFLVTLRVVHRLVTGTRSMATYYATTFGFPRVRIHVVPNDIDLDRFVRDEEEAQRWRRRLDAVGRPLVLFVHRLAPRKGATVLPELIERVAHEVPTVLFAVAGDGPSRAEFEREILHRGIGDRVRILGRVPNRNIPGLFGAADVFVMPSLEEGFPRVLLEAMASEVPFVASDVGGVADMCVAAQHECLVPVDDVRGFAKKTTELLLDAATRARLAAIGRARAQEFSVEAVVNTFIREIWAS
jgi:glycosyltransferase involved in cell wall biosynthesis